MMARVRTLDVPDRGGVLLPADKVLESFEDVS